MRIPCRTISKGYAEGELIVSRKNFSFLGDVDPESGLVKAKDSDIYGKNISGKIFAFPTGRGSTVGTYVLLRMKKAGSAPLAIINEKTEAIIAVGAIISDIPLVDGADLSKLKTGMKVVVNATEGYIEIPDWL
ncbi:putative aconitase subunit 2 [Archaeoglobus sulfaticallidus PM70-1]|uniref:Phosphomevalonate dehydratase small subunit n=1 Tax=Archaeoglobus sulfaticallidus PM70-1 TaxID=387631 RepID=N0BD57_9EURY|nr:DUF126 domain-containing protein [Archaeoglobus sulfaticallidus]AGK60177.1 putative aconitase subunit 2 [Archaeoglobus sulfaticallidus PM70-1]